MNSIVIGASSTIAQAIIQNITPDNDAIIAVSSQALTFNNPRIKPLHCDYSEASIKKTVNDIQNIGLTSIDRVYICNGVLQNDTISVEKRLENINTESFLALITSNALTPILWLQALLPLLKQQTCTITVFSARVASITDNQLGGWYSYRASKAALNMLLKTASIEYAKRAKNIKLLAFHPGTTDTPLSRPFQHNVPENKLFTAEFVAQQLERIIVELPFDKEISFLDWQGETIDW